MNLLDIRKQFRVISGRHDLVNKDGSDNGATFFINEGSKYLDRLFTKKESYGIYPVFAYTGDLIVRFPLCRAVQEVWAASTTARWQLEKEDVQDLLANYITKPPDQIDNGTTLYYAPAVSRYIPEDQSDFSSFEDYLGSITPTDYDYNSIIIAPPPDEDLVLEIKGLFYSLELTADTDSNFWTHSHPLLLVMAAMRQIEVVNRNTQGVKDWTGSINDEILTLDMDLVEQQIAEFDQMEG